MKKLILIITLAILFSCNKENIDPLNLQWKPEKISSIKTIRAFPDSDVKESSKVFEYNENDQLIKVIEDSDEEWIYFYDNEGKLSSINQFNLENTVMVKDSFVYSTSSKIDKVLRYRINFGNQVLELRSELTYKYDNLDQIVRVDTEFLTFGTTSKAKFFWSQGNIVESKLWSDGELSLETKFKYDGNTNYKINNPYFFFEASWSKNNVIESDVTDHEGTIDFFCYKCKTKYNYKNDRPEKVEYEWYTTDEINYFD